VFERFRRAAVLGSALIVLSGALTLLLTSTRLEDRIDGYSAPEFIVALIFATSSVICAWHRVDRYFRKKFEGMHELHVIDQSTAVPIVYAVASVGAFLLVGAMGLAATAHGYGIAISIAIVSVLHGLRRRTSPIPAARLVGRPPSASR